MYHVSDLFLYIISWKEYFLSMELKWSDLEKPGCIYIYSETKNELALINLQKGNSESVFSGLWWTSSDEGFSHIHNDFKMASCNSSPLILLILWLSYWLI